MSTWVDRQRPLRLAAYGILIGLLVLAAIPVYLALDPSWRPMMVRLACAGAVTVGSIRVVRGVRRTTDGHSLSPIDAPPPAPPTAILDEVFLRRRDELAYSVRSRRYFDAVLWPRLLALAGTPLPQPPGRRWLTRLGPSRATLESLIAQIERRA